MRFLFLIFFFSACGYSVSQAQALPKGYTRVYVNQAMDNSADVAAAATLTRVLRERIDASRVARQASLADAEVVLEARIDGVGDIAATRIDGVKTIAPPVPKYLLAMSGSARLVDKAGQVVWQSGSLRVEEDYLSGTLACRDQGDDTKAVACSDALLENAVPLTEADRRRALDRAAQQLADVLYTRLMEGF